MELYILSIDDDNGGLGIITAHSTAESAHAAVRDGETYAIITLTLDGPAEGTTEVFMKLNGRILPASYWQ